MTQEVLKLALEFLEDNQDLIEVYERPEYLSMYKAAINKCKEALAQPEQEPVKIVQYNCTCGKTMKFESVHGVIAPQRIWVGLTDDDKVLINHDANFNQFMTVGEYADRVQQLTEARLKDKNT